jgi:hypothetical protein
LPLLLLLLMLPLSLRGPPGKPTTMTKKTMMMMTRID